MKTTYRINTLICGAALAAGIPAISSQAFAHCDTLDGPVVAAASQALATTNVSLALIWVQMNDEAEIKRAFEKTIAVRSLNASARELADMYFFETLVRVHRAGEGAPYTGLKAAGGDLGPAIPAADKSVESGKIEPVARLLAEAMHDGLRKRFAEVQARKTYPKGDTQAGREYVKAYVEFVHYVEGVHGAVAGASGEHGHEEDTPAAHEHH